MKKITKKDLKTMVSSLMMEPTDEVLEQILKEWKTISHSLALLDKLDLNNVKPLTHINEEKYVDMLREDVVDTSFAITKQQALSNAKEHDQDFIITKKVVK